jgi:hypothetical protein
VTRHKLRLAAAVWIALLVAFSLQPWRLRAIAGGRPLHPALHVVMFGLAALFPLLLSASLVREWTRALSVLCLGIGIEVVQGLVYRHHTEWKDFKSDVLGILSAILVVRFGRNTGLLPRVGPPNQDGNDART